MHIDPKHTMEYLEPAPATVPKRIARWALYSDVFGFHRPLPHQTEQLYDSRRSAIAARLSGSLYPYLPVKVELLVVPPARRSVER